MRKSFIFIILALVCIVVFLVFVLIGCSSEVEISEVVNAFTSQDEQSPVLENVESASSSIVKLVFNEPVKVFESSFDPFVARADGKCVYVTLNTSLPPGKMSEIKGRVKDYHGNTTGFSVKVWGFNPRMPQVQINEFTTKGTEKSPDRTELLVLGDGNINGMSLYCGVPDDYDAMYTFEDIEVKKGQYIVVWWCKEIPQKIELQEGVLHVCSNTEEGASSNNGTQVLCSAPSLGAKILDAVVYSNYTTSNEGFGTRVALERATWVKDSGTWEGDAIDSTSSTATRSMFKSLGNTEKGSCKNWNISVTGGSTFGSDNTSQVF